MIAPLAGQANSRNMRPVSPVFDSTKPRWNQHKTGYLGSYLGNPVFLYKSDLRIKVEAFIIPGGQQILEPIPEESGDV
jgi:hypothetical protein